MLLHIKLERLVGEKHSSLLGPFVSYEEIKCYEYIPGGITKISRNNPIFAIVISHGDSGRGWARTFYIEMMRLVFFQSVTAVVTTQGTRVRIHNTSFSS